MEVKNFYHNSGAKMMPAAKTKSFYFLFSKLAGLA